MIITTRSRGYGYHGSPLDCWRYEVQDMQAILSDFVIEALESDRLMPGVFLKARKPGAFKENDLANYQLYSMIRGKPTRAVTAFDINLFTIRRTMVNFLSKTLPKPIKHFINSSVFHRREL